MRVYEKLSKSCRKVVDNFTGTYLQIPKEFVEDELLVIVDGLVQTPYTGGGTDYDYRTRDGEIIFRAEPKDATIQLIPVTVCYLKED